MQINFYGRNHYAIPNESVIIMCFAALQRRKTTENGKVAEWSNALDSKSSIRFSRIEGSNPSLSASDAGSADNAR